MAKVSLRAYNREIESLIEQGNRLDEAVAHCRHILKTYPKHLETYRLLGKAYLEGKRYDQAVDIFQRILVAEPEDFVSHVGMSIIADDQGKLDEAIWHMERAFEVQPSNAAIQGELQRLFGRRDGVEPPKIRLTRGALAHMYVQGELYTQAISEIRAVLAHDENRMDMQVLLARAFFRNGQKAEASEVCTALLAVSPYCLEPNRLMAEILAGGQSDEAVREHRRRVFELDPYAEFVKGPADSVSGVSDGAVTIPRLEYVEEHAAVGSPVPVLGLDESLATEDRSAPPAWMSARAEAPASSAVMPAPDGMPDFMKQAGWHQIPSGSEDQAPIAEPTAEPEPSAIPGELPDWVRALAPSEPSSTESMDGDAAGRLGDAEAAETQAAGASETVFGSSDSETPDWLRELSREPEPREVASFPRTPGQTPWTPRADAQPPEDGAGSPAQDDGLAWLEGLAEKHGAKPEELLTAPGQRTSAPPAWVGSIPADEKRAKEPVPEAADETPATQPAVSSERTSEPYDWLSGLSDEGTFREAESPSEADDLPIMDSPPAGVWPRPEPTSVSGELPDWLKTSASPAVDAVPEPARETSGEYESTPNLPDWLAGLDVEKSDAPAQQMTPPPTPAAAGEDLPDWLREEPESTPSAVSSAPSEWKRVEPEAAAVRAPTEQTPAVPLTRERASTTRERPAEEEFQLSPRQGGVGAGPPAGGPTLAGAKAELGRGNIAAALDMYTKLIRKGRSLEEIIRDLRDALYRYPVEVPIWQSLGDAYMRANRLQEALDAYTKAEELLR